MRLRVYLSWDYVALPIVIGWAALTVGILAARALLILALRRGGELARDPVISGSGDPLLHPRAYLAFANEGARGAEELIGLLRAEFDKAEAARAWYGAEAFPVECILDAAEPRRHCLHY